MVRYADDCVVCFQYKEEAEGFLESVRKRLAKFGLELSEEKTKNNRIWKMCNRK